MMWTTTAPAGAADCQLGRTTPHSRVDERLEVLPRGEVGEDDAAERRTVQ